MKKNTIFDISIVLAVEQVIIRFSTSSITAAVVAAFWQRYARQQRTKRSAIARAKISSQDVSGARQIVQTAQWLNMLESNSRIGFGAFLSLSSLQLK